MTTQPKLKPYQETLKKIRAKLAEVESDLGTLDTQADAEMSQIVKNRDKMRADEVAKLEAVIAKKDGEIKALGEKLGRLKG